MIASTLLAAATPFVDLNSGATASMAAVTLSIARRYFILAVLLGFLLEAAEDLRLPAPALREIAGLVASRHGTPLAAPS